MSIEYSRTKIIATLGPASSEKDVLRKMIKAGVDVFRLNFSHGEHENKLILIKTIRELNQELKTNVAIMADLQGPKIRIGELENGQMKISRDQIITFVISECPGNEKEIHINYDDFPSDVQKGDTILIDDGKLKLEVVSTNRTDKVEAKVIFGGMLYPRKGVNLPNTEVTLPSLTEKDIEDALFALENEVDWLALSFVRAVSDVIELKQMIKRKKKNALVIAKIEKPQAIENLDQIIEEADAIMVARGDLGVEIDFDIVPVLQKEIVRKCIDMHTPVIIATQMMESMISNFRPTRAEATDVANAVIDGADTLMLSGETSVGEFPLETIHSMHKLIRYTEEKSYNYNRGIPPKPESPRFIRDSICYSASIMAERIGAKAIITFTDLGSTAKTISGYRPKADIFAFTKHIHLLSSLSLLWGVKAFYFDKFENINIAVDESIKVLKDNNLIFPGDYVIHVGSTPLSVTHKTNILKVTKVS